MLLKLLVLQQYLDVAAQVAFVKADLGTGFSRWVNGQAQGLEPGGFKLWVNWIQVVQAPP
jgi:hypothetical protein